MTKVSLKFPFEVEIYINESLDKTYEYVSTQYTPDSVNDTAVVTYTLNETSSSPSTFEETFNQVLAGLTVDATIDIYLKDENGNTVASFIRKPVIVRP